MEMQHYTNAQARNRQINKENTNDRSRVIFVDSVWFGFVLD